MERARVGVGQTAEIAMKLASLELQLKYIDRREARLGMSEDVTAGDAEGEAVRKRKLSLQRKIGVSLIILVLTTKERSGPP